MTYAALIFFLFKMSILIKEVIIMEAKRHVGKNLENEVFHKILTLDSAYFQKH